MFHILHHHTMKLLLAFKSFLPRRLIVEIGSENWFAGGCPLRQRGLVCCRLPTSAARTGSLPAAHFGSENCFAAGNQFGSENCFAAGATISAANANS